MFFVFLILLFTFHVTEIDSIPFRNKIIESRNKHHNREIISIKDDVGEKISSLSTFGPLFHVLQNTSHTWLPNLQSNVYDKMLSDEMFSITEFKNQNTKNNTKVPIFAKISAPTPTLELKQKWPVIEFLATINSNVQNEEKINSNNEIEDSISINQNIHQKENQTKNKVVELRSISEEAKQHQNPLQNIARRYCTCMNSNAFTTCSHRENSKLCTHDPKYDFRHEPDMLTPYPAFYLPYQSYFLGATPDNPYKVTYYHPSIFNELKVPKKKKHRYPSTTQFDEDLYYENNHNKAKKKYYDYLENDKGSDDIYKPKKSEVLINIDYDIKNKGSKNSEPGIVKKDPGFNDILSDLDSVYSDCAVKKCYCSSSYKKKFKFCRFPYILFTAIILYRS